MNTFTLILMSTVYANSWQAQSSQAPPAQVHGYTLQECEREADRWIEGGAVAFSENGIDGVVRVREAHCVAEPSSAAADPALTMSDGVLVVAR